MKHNTHKFNQEVKRLLKSDCAQHVYVENNGELTTSLGDSVESFFGKDQGGTNECNIVKMSFLYDELGVECWMITYDNNDKCIAYFS